MNWRDIGIVFRKEWAQTMRNRKTIMIMISVLITQPILLTATAALLERRIEAEIDKPAEVIVLGEDGQWFAQELTAGSRLVVATATGGKLRDALAKGSQTGAFVAELPAGFRSKLAQAPNSVPEIKLYTNNQHDTLLQRKTLDDALSALRERITANRLQSASLPPEIGKDFSVKIQSVGGAQNRTGALLGLIIPIELVLTLLLASLYCATDLVTAERERGTLVLLAVSPVSRRDIILAKTIVILSIALIAMVGLMIIQLGLLHLFVHRGVDTAGAYPLVLPIGGALLSVTLAAPLALLITSIAVGVASYARNFQQAQSYYSLIVIFLMAPAIAPLMPTSQYPPAAALVPIASTALSLRDALSGQLSLGFALVSVLSTCVYSAALLFVSTRLLDSEHAIFPQDEPLGSWRSTTRLLITFLLGVFLAYFLVGPSLQNIAMLPGLLASQIFIIGLPAVLFVKWLRLGTVEVLGLSAKGNVLRTIAAPLLAPALFFLGVGIMAVQDLILPAPRALEELMLRVLIPAGQPLWLVYVTVAMAPAVCEELLFRGLVQGALSKSLPPRVVLPVTAIAFGMFHMSTFRFLPTTILGFVLCLMRWKFKSIYPSMALHCANNALAVYVAVNHINPFTWQNGVIAAISFAVAVMVMRIPAR